MNSSVLFSPPDLLPLPWSRLAAEGPVRMFNPGLQREGDGWIFAYRVVGMDGLRRIALCRLDRSLRPVPGSATAFSDLVSFAADSFPERARAWFADPRLYRLQGRWFVYWNSGWHEPRNHQFLQEFDPVALRPVGPPRELVRRGERRVLEKNWVLFEEDDVYAVYSANPHCLLSCALDGSGEIACTEIGSAPWDDGGYAGAYGGLRGGAPPQRVGDRYTSFCHTVHLANGGYDYFPAVYRFAALPPFAPTDAPAGRLALPNPAGTKRLFPKLNPAVNEVVYPCGAVSDQGRWIVSYGVNDEHCAIAVIREDDVLKSLRPLHAPAL